MNKPLHYIAFKILSMLILILADNAYSSEETISIYYSEKSSKYINAAEKIKAKIEEKIKSKDIPVNINLRNINSLHKTKPPIDDLVIFVGEKGVNPSHIEIIPNPIIYSFINQENLSTEQNNKIKKNGSAILINQPIKESILVADSIIKHNYKNNVIIATASENKGTLSRIKESSKLKSSTLKIVGIEKGENSAKLIEEHLFNAAALIAIKDKRVWSNKNAGWMLHQAYSYKVPVIGYSEAFLKAGAMISIYSSQEEIIASVSKEATTWIETKKISRKIIFSKPTLKVNKNVARALGYSKSDIKKIEGIL